MKRIAASIGRIGVLMMACGPEPVAQTELEEVCGEAEPFRVLALPPDQQVAYDRPLQVGERLLFVVSRVEPAEPHTFGPKTSEPTVWSVGSCGESPVQLATGVDSLFTVDAWPDVPLGCMQETGEVVALDPLGVREPHVVFSGEAGHYGCGVRWTEYGLLSVEPHDDELAALLLHPYPDDPYTQTAEPVVLLDPVRITDTGLGGTGIVANSIRTFPDSVLAITADDVLMRVDLADRSIAALQHGVRMIETSSDARHVLWQDAIVTGGDAGRPEGKVFLRDTRTGGDALLAQTSLAYGILPLLFAPQGVVQLRLGDFGVGMQRVFFLPGLESVDAPAEWMLYKQIDDDRWFAGLLLGSEYRVVDLRAGGSRPLLPRPAQLLAYEDDGVLLFEARQCCIDGDPRDEGPLWRVPWDGEPQRLADRVSRHMVRLEDGRIAGPVGIDENWIGSLVVLDPETGKETRIDDRVTSVSVNLAWAGDDGLVSYSVSDGERSGIYLARLPAHARSRAREGARREAVVVDVVRGADGRPVPVPRSLSEVPDGRALRVAAGLSRGGE